MIRKLWHSHRMLLRILGTVCLILLNGYSEMRGQAIMGARELGMGQAVTALSTSSWSVFGNPAMMDQKSRTASFFGVRYYGLSEITDMATALNYPTENGVIGLGAHRYGFDLYNESHLRLGYKNDFQGFHFGAVFSYNHVMQGGGYGSAGAWGLDLGIGAPIVPQLWIGAKATNINRPEYGSRNGEKLPRDLSIGFSYRPSNKALLSTELIKDVEFPLAFRSGVEVFIVDGFAARTGITTEPLTFSGGLGYESDFVGVNFSVQRHENTVLGFSPAIDFKLIW